jgi:L-lysine 6-transaminase
MVRCVRYLEVIREDGLLENAARVGAALKEGLDVLAGAFEEVSNVRGQGLLAAFDLPDADMRSRVVQGSWERGLAILACGPRSVRLRPPLVFSEAEATQALGTLHEVLRGLG